MRKIKIVLVEVIKNDLSKYIYIYIYFKEKNDLSIKEITKNMTLNRLEWRARINVVNINLSIEDPKLTPKFWD